MVSLLNLVKYDFMTQHRKYDFITFIIDFVRVRFLF